MLLRSHDAGSCPTACPPLQTGPEITLKSIPKACQSHSFSTAPGWRCLVFSGWGFATTGGDNPKSPGTAC